MTTIAWPANLVPQRWEYGIEQDVQLTVTRSGRVYTHELPGARWTGTLAFREQNDRRATTERPAVEALIVRLRGGARRLQMHMHHRPVPRGTLRGEPRISSAVSAGANTLPLSNCNGTLLAGDFIGLGGQILMVEENATPAAGAMTVKITPALRSAHASLTNVTWDRPATLWIPLDSSSGPFPADPGGVRRVITWDLVEAP